MGVGPLKSRGGLIVFEGIDNVGKTSMARLLGQYFKTLGIPCTNASFPGDIPGTLSAHIYRLYHNPSRFRIHTVDQQSLQMLMTAAHIEVIRTQILPAIRKKHIVILDRYWWSTWVYAQAEGVTRSFTEKLLEVESHAWEDVSPACIFWVRRGSAERTISTSRAQPARLYGSLARRERRRNDYPIIELRNDRRLYDCLAELIDVLRARFLVG